MWPPPHIPTSTQSNGRFRNVSAPIDNKKSVEQSVEVRREQLVKCPPRSLLKPSRLIASLFPMGHLEIGLAERTSAVSYTHLTLPTIYSV